MMKEFGFVYDSSIPAPLSDPPIWPYTLDYKIPHKCIGDRKCPSRYVTRDHPSNCRLPLINYNYYNSIIIL